jgi:DNA-directed RNA polymerase subunit omega
MPAVAHPAFLPGGDGQAALPTDSPRTTMIDALKSDEIVNKLGGRFKLTALIQRRLGELIDGARPLVDRNGRSDFEVVIDEILHDKITIDFEASNIPLPGSERIGRT